MKFSLFPALTNFFAVKLNADKLAQGADHAILSSNKFPRDKREIHLQDGVIVAAPARVLAIVEILRDQLIRLSELRVSNEQRDGKTEELYGFTNVNFAKVAESFGCVGIRAETPAQVKEALAKAFAMKRPVIIDAVTDINAFAKRAWLPEGVSSGH